MRFALAGYGSRGDAEPFAAVGRELLRRGHDVRMAVSPHMLDFVESAGLAAVAYGPRPRQQLNAAADSVHQAQNPINVVGEMMEHVSQALAESSTTLTALADGADLLVTGTSEQRLGANVAEYYDIPLAALHFFPPAPDLEPGLLFRHLTKEAEDAQRRDLGLPQATGSSTRRVVEASLEIQAYDELCFPEVAVEWAELSRRRPFVGALTMELPTDVDGEVLSWIAEGTPPIYFGFGSSVRVASPADTVAVIGAACAQLGERALICSGGSDLTDVALADHVKVVSAVNHAAVFPACRAVVHHGGAGTTAAGLRAGVPMLILWLWLDHPMWAAVVERLQVGKGREFSNTTQDSLVSDLRTICDAHYVTRAREVATRLTNPAQSVASAADLLEETARLGRVG